MNFISVTVFLCLCLYTNIKADNAFAYRTGAHNCYDSSSGKVPCHESFIRFKSSNQFFYYRDMHFYPMSASGIIVEYSAIEDGNLDIFFDNINSSPIASIPIKSTNRKIVYFKTKNLQGIHTVYFRSSNPGFDLYSFQFTEHDFSQFLTPRLKIKASLFSEGSDVDVEQCLDKDEGKNLQNIKKGNWFKYENIDLTDKAILKLRVAGLNEGEINVILDEITNNPIATIRVPITGGWQKWKTIKAKIASFEGKHDIYIVFKSSGHSLNWLEFKKKFYSNEFAIEYQPSSHSDNYYFAFPIDIDEENKIFEINPPSYKIENNKTLHQIIDNVLKEFKSRIEKMIKDKNYSYNHDLSLRNEIKNYFLDEIIGTGAYLRVRNKIDKIQKKIPIVSSFKVNEGMGNVENSYKSVYIVRGYYDLDKFVDYLMLELIRRNDEKLDRETGLIQFLVENRLYGLANEIVDFISSRDIDNDEFFYQTFIKSRNIDKQNLIASLAICRETQTIKKIFSYYAKQFGHLNKDIHEIGIFQGS